MLSVVGTDPDLGDPPYKEFYQLPISFTVSENGPKLEHNGGGRTRMFLSAYI
jgi:hypothetical protein